MDLHLVDPFPGSDPFAGVSGDPAERTFIPDVFGIGSGCRDGPARVECIFPADDDAFRDRLLRKIPSADDAGPLLPGGHAAGVDLHPPYWKPAGVGKRELKRSTAEKFRPNRRPCFDRHISGTNHRPPVKVRRVAPIGTKFHLRKNRPNKIFLVFVANTRSQLEIFPI